MTFGGDARSGTEPAKSIFGQPQTQIGQSSDASKTISIFGQANKTGQPSIPSTSGGDASKPATNIFGKPTGASAFSFGTTPSSTAAGTSGATFGSGSKPADSVFGQTTFGQQGSASPFGAPSTTSGEQKPSTFTFGAAAGTTPTFGGSSLNTSAFGSFGVKPTEEKK